MCYLLLTPGVFVAEFSISSDYTVPSPREKSDCLDHGKLPVDRATFNVKKRNGLSML